MLPWLTCSLSSKNCSRQPVNQRWMTLRCWRQYGARLTEIGDDNMNSPTRRKTTMVVSVVGLFLLFVCIFTLPEAIVRLSRAASETGTEPMTTQGWVMVSIGFATLVAGGALSVIGMVLRRTAAPESNPEDELLDGRPDHDETVRDYDPLDLHPQLRRRREGH